jgi:hypothetical protein
MRIWRAFFGFPGAGVTHPTCGGNIGIFTKKYPYIWRAAGQDKMEQNSMFYSIVNEHGTNAPDGMV